jgi:hypothetical protein
MENPPAPGISNPAVLPTKNRKIFELSEIHKNEQFLCGFPSILRTEKFLRPETF